jgi:hypothetical protein
MGGWLVQATVAGPINLEYRGRRRETTLGWASVRERPRRGYCRLSATSVPRDALEQGHHVVAVTCRGARDQRPQQ